LLQVHHKGSGRTELPPTCRVGVRCSGTAYLHLHLSPCHPFLFTASTSSTRQTRRPSPERTHTSLASNASSRSATASQGTQSPSATPSQSRTPAWSLEPVCSPGLFGPLTLPESEPACPRRPADSARNASFMLDAGWRATRRSLLPSHYQAIRPTIWRCRRRAAGARPRNKVPRTPHATPRHATRSSPRSRKPPSHHASFLRSMNHHRYCAQPSHRVAHAGPRRQR